MKIVLRAFGNKLSGIMEVPEETGHRFKLAMVQPIQCQIMKNNEVPMMSSPIHKICTFEWNGGTFFQKDHDWDGAREYQLIDIN